MVQGHLKKLAAGQQASGHTSAPSKVVNGAINGHARR